MKSSMYRATDVGRAIYLLRAELERASTAYDKFNSAHEGLAVIEEEFLELRSEVYKRQTERSADLMRGEAIQVAAMALRFILDITGDK